MTSIVTEFISRAWRVPPGDLHVQVQPLRGALESTVALVRVSQQQSPRSIPPRLVIKRLLSGFEREANVYDVLWRHIERPPAVRMLGRDVRADTTYLYLEEAQRESAWPWSDTTRAAAVCLELARLHEAPTLPRESFVWNYDAELADSAESTLELARDARNASGQRCWRRLGDLKRVVLALPDMATSLARVRVLVNNASGAA